MPATSQDAWVTLKIPGAPRAATSSSRGLATIFAITELRRTAAVLLAALAFRAAGAGSSTGRSRRALSFPGGAAYNSKFYVHERSSGTSAAQSASVGHRPLQPPVRILHAGRRLRVATARRRPALRRD